jgi:hypothetical protein
MLPLDQEWFKRLERNLVSISLDGDKEYTDNQKKLFFENKIENPTLLYSKLDKQKLLTQQKSLSKLKEDILENESNNAVKEAYIGKIDYELGQIELYLATLTNDMLRFKECTENLYSAPTEEIFKLTLKEIFQETDTYTSKQKEVLEAKAFLEETFSNIDLSHIKVQIPTHEDFKNAQKKLASKISFINNISTKKEELDASDCKDMLEQALKYLNIKRWKAKIDNDSQIDTINIKKKEKLVAIPSQRKANAEKFRKTVVHEIGCHVVRAINGQKTSLRLLSLGLDRYLPVEEGLASLYEQLLDEEFTAFTGKMHYFAISLAYGMDGTKRDFRQLFEVIKHYCLIKHLSSESNDLSKAQEKSYEEAWKVCIRTFRGTDCKTPGICWTKNLAYRIGNIKLWHLIMENSKEIDRIDIGKYDPTNLRHVDILNKLNIK